MRHENEPFAWWRLADADSVLHLTPVSKPLASTVVSAVVGDGTAARDSRMADIDPRFALRDPLATEAVTLADLVAHRGGLPDHAGALELRTAGLVACGLAAPD